LGVAVLVFMILAMYRTPWLQLLRIDFAQGEVSLYTGYHPRRLWHRATHPLSNMRMERSPAELTFTLTAHGSGWTETTSALVLRIPGYQMVLACQPDLDAALASMPSWVRSLQIDEGPPLKARADRKLGRKL